MTAAARLVGSSVLIAGCCLLPPPARAQQGCPVGSPCVTSQTWLVSGDNNIMDVYTEATQDLDSAFYYAICINLAVLQVNPANPLVSTWQVPVHSTPLPYCTSSAGYPAIGSDTTDYGPIPWATFTATPGYLYYAYGLGELAAPTYACLSDGDEGDCDYSSDAEGPFADAEGFSTFIESGGDGTDLPGLAYSWPGVFGQVIIGYQIIALNSSGMFAFAAAAATGPVPQITFTDTSTGSNITTNVTNNTTPVNVLVGQLIELNATVPGLQGGQLLEQEWSQPPGVAVGGYNVEDYPANTPPLGSAVVVPLPNDTEACQALVADDCLNFYWVEAGQTGTITRSITFYYTVFDSLGNELYSNQATAQFTANSPSGVMVTGWGNPGTNPPTMNPPNIGIPPQSRACTYSSAQAPTRRTTSTESTSREARHTPPPLGPTASTGGSSWSTWTIGNIDLRQGLASPASPSASWPQPAIRARPASRRLTVASPIIPTASHFPATG